MMIVSQASGMMRAFLLSMAPNHLHIGQQNLAVLARHRQEGDPFQAPGGLNPSR